MSLLSSFSNNSNQRQWFYIPAVLLLAVAQFFAQLHSLEHLDEHEGEEHSELSCNLCILSADLENNIPALGKTPDNVDHLRSPTASGFTNPPFHSLSHRFLPRAPPVIFQFS